MKEILRLEHIQKFYGNLTKAISDISFSVGNAASYAERILFLQDGMIFTEILKGGNSRKEFFEKILDVITMLGGCKSDVC